MAELPDPNKKKANNSGEPDPATGDSPRITGKSDSRREDSDGFLIADSGELNLQMFNESLDEEEFTIEFPDEDHDSNVIEDMEDPDDYSEDSFVEDMDDSPSDTYEELTEEESSELVLDESDELEDTGDYSDESLVDETFLDDETAAPSTSEPEPEFVGHTDSYLPEATVLSAHSSNSLRTEQSTQQSKSWGPYLKAILCVCLLYTSPSPRDGLLSRMPSSA